jgi:hypothetical protein
MEKKENSSLSKKKKFSKEKDDFGFGSSLISKKQSSRVKIKERLCSVEGIIYF